MDRKHNPKGLVDYEDDEEEQDEGPASGDTRSSKSGGRNVNKGELMSPPRSQRRDDDGKHRDRERDRDRDRDRDGNRHHEKKRHTSRSRSRSLERRRKDVKRDNSPKHSSRDKQRDFGDGRGRHSNQGNERLSDRRGRSRSKERRSNRRSRSRSRERQSHRRSRSRSRDRKKDDYKAPSKSRDNQRERERDRNSHRSHDHERKRHRSRSASREHSKSDHSRSSNSKDLTRSGRREEWQPSQPLPSSSNAPSGFAPLPTSTPSILSSPPPNLAATAQPPHLISHPPIHQPRMSFPVTGSLSSYPPPMLSTMPSTAGVNPLPPGLSHYNPQTVNIARMAEQLEKRKLLWGDKPKKPSQSDQDHNEASNSSSSCSSSGQSSSVWTSIQFSGDKGAQMTEKFRKLMGIKDKSHQSTSIPAAHQSQSPSQSQSSTDAAAAANPLINQQKLFDQLDDQYSRARMATHTQRGVGLGFNTYH